MDEEKPNLVFVMVCRCCGEPSVDSLPVCTFCEATVKWLIEDSKTPKLK